MVSETPGVHPGGHPRTSGPMGGDEVFRIIQERLADILEIDESRITMEASFQDDLSADSLALIELVEALEQELEHVTTGFRIEDEDLADLRTVRDAVEYVVERVG
jgi:acyl carrier protein